MSIPLITLSMEEIEKRVIDLTFNPRDRYEIAYSILVWKILQGMEGHESVHRSVLITALARAAGELS